MKKIIIFRDYPEHKRRAQIYANTMFPDDGEVYLAEVEDVYKKSDTINDDAFFQLMETANIQPQECEFHFILTSNVDSKGKQMADQVHHLFTSEGRFLMCADYVAQLMLQEDRMKKIFAGVVELNEEHEIIGKALNIWMYPMKQEKISDWNRAGVDTDRYSTKKNSTQHIILDAALDQLAKANSLLKYITPINRQIDEEISRLEATRNHWFLNSPDKKIAALNTLKSAIQNKNSEQTTQDILQAWSKANHDLMHVNRTRPWFFQSSALPKSAVFMNRLLSSFGVEQAPSLKIAQKNTQ